MDCKLYFHWIVSLHVIIQIYIQVHAALTYMFTAATEPGPGKNDTHLIVFLI